MIFFFSFVFVHLADTRSPLDDVSFDHLSLDEVEVADSTETLFVNVFFLPGQEPLQGIKSGSGFLENARFNI